MDGNEAKREQLKRLDRKLRGMRLAVYDAWRTHGPATTLAMAAITGMSILTLRPRTTELVELGLVRQIRLEDGQGIYQAVAIDQVAEGMIMYASHAKQCQFQLAGV